MSIPVEEAIALAREHAVPLPEQEAPLLAALGRVLARPVLAPQPQPPFARSPLDGYAVRAADTVGATPEVPVVLQVVDKLYAGQETRIAVHAGEAVRIMTGAMLPQGADGVILQEDTDLGEDRVRIYRAERPDRNCCHKGEEYDAGAVLLAADTKVDAAAIAVAASAVEMQWRQAIASSEFKKTVPRGDTCGRTPTANPCSCPRHSPTGRCAVWWAATAWWTFPQAAARCSKGTGWIFFCCEREVPQAWGAGRHSGRPT